MEKVDSISFSNVAMKIRFESGLTLRLPISIEYSAKYSSGDLLSELEVEMLQQFSQNYFCREKALRYMVNPHSEKQLCDYLTRKEFSKSSIKSALTFLQKQGYIDDHSYAEAYLLSLMRRKVVGRNYAQNKLMQKGISRLIISEIIEQYASLFENGDDLFLFACKKYNSLANKKNIYSKLLYALSSRGFSNGEIYRTLERMKNDGYKFEQR